jgi:hypothetical protein
VREAGAGHETTLVKRDDEFEFGGRSCNTISTGNGTPAQHSGKLQKVALPVRYKKAKNFREIANVKLSQSQLL